MTNYTHEIVSMKRAETSGSKSPMWRCVTKSGEPVNVFEHLSPDRDTSRLFIEAGYFDLMSALKPGEVLEWSNHPIPVVMVSDGKWWTVTAVAQKPEGAEPDVLWQPDLKAYRARAIQRAQMIFDNAFRCVDSELTGLRTDDEMTAISVIDENGDMQLDTYLKPAHPEKLLRVQKDGMSAADVTGITPELLENTRCFKDAYANIYDALEIETWVAYNAGFDVAALDRECSNAGVPLLMPNAVHDVAMIAAEYLGNWNPKRQWFEMLKLGDAASQLGVQVEVVHQAGSDAKTTYDILKAIAADVLGDPF